VGTFQCGYLLPRSQSGYSGASYDSFIGIRGTLGRIAWNPFEREATGLQVESVAPGWEAAPGRVLRYEFAKSDAYGGSFGLRFVQDFVRAAQSGGAPPVTGEDALRVMRVIEAAYESSRTGRRVDLPHE
jgi:predicted dehydrogenase